MFKLAVNQNLVDTISKINFRYLTTEKLFGKKNQKENVKDNFSLDKAIYFSQLESSQLVGLAEKIRMPNTSDVGNPEENLKDVLYNFILGPLI